MSSYYLTIASVFRNEAACLAEWIEFHRMQGVEHFFLYNNGSDDDYRSAVQPFLDARCVTLLDWPDFSDACQRNMYDDALRRLQEQARWLAFIDVDEFLFSPAGGTLPQVLQSLEPHAGVVVNWQVYGSGGLVERLGLVIDSFTRRAETDYFRNYRVKSIVDPSRVVSPKGPHLFQYSQGELAVTEHGQPVRAVDKSDSPAPSDPDPLAVNILDPRCLSVDRLRINHYAVKSRSEYLHKERRFAHRGYAGRRFQDYWRVHDKNDVEDPILVPLASRLRRRLGLLGSQ